MPVKLLAQIREACARLTRLGPGVRIQYKCWLHAPTPFLGQPSLIMSQNATCLPPPHALRTPQHWPNSASTSPLTWDGTEAGSSLCGLGQLPALAHLLVMWVYLFKMGKPADLAKAEECACVHVHSHRQAHTFWILCKLRCCQSIRKNACRANKNLSLESRAKGALSGSVICTYVPYIIICVHDRTIVCKKKKVLICVCYISPEYERGNGSIWAVGFV